jgi:hypothetical protein
MSDTIQTALARFFEFESTLRRRSFEDGAARGTPDVRAQCSAEWLALLAAYVEKLPDDDVGIRTLAGFDWPVPCFLRGPGSESRQAALKLGFKGGPDRPLVYPPSLRDLSRAWDVFVMAAERDYEDVAQLLAIVSALLPDSHSSVRAALGRFTRNGNKMSAPTASTSRGGN